MYSWSISKIFNVQMHSFIKVTVVSLSSSCNLWFNNQYINSDIGDTLCDHTRCFWQLYTTLGLPVPF